MVLLTLATLAAGAAGAGVTWSRCGKKSLGRQMKGFAESLISKALAGSSCKLGGVDFKLSGCEMQIGVSGVEVGNLPPYKSESLLKIASVYLAVNLQSLLRSGFKQVIIEELLVDGLQLTVEKIHLTTNNVKELLRKIAEKKSDQSGEVEQPTNQTMMGALPQGMPTLNTVAGGVSNAADGMAQLGKATATRVAAIGQPAKRQEPKDSMVCLKKVEVRSIVVHSVNAMMSDNKTASLSLKAPPIRFLNFSESHGVQNAADMIQLLLREILGSASRVVSDLAKDSASSAGSYLGGAASTISEAATSVGGALGGVVMSSADSVCVFWNWLSQPALPSK
ncbi:unnamed protein product [Symbiodinium sp. CCMP2456]|nr:unnamed protein product [Symbiodinium sp. CCMP2456]